MLTIASAGGPDAAAFAGSRRSTADLCRFPDFLPDARGGSGNGCQNFRFVEQHRLVGLDRGSVLLLRDRAFIQRHVIFGRDIVLFTIMHNEQ